MPYFSVLGPLEVIRAGRVVRLGGARQKALLATLLLYANRPVSIADLTDRIWNDKPPADARRTIQVYVTRLRRALGNADLVRFDPAGYLIRIEPHQLDLLRFDTLVGDAANTTDAHKRSELLTAALELWRGPACSDVASDVLQAVDIPPLNERRLDAQERLIDVELDLGRHGVLLGRLRRLVNEHPLRERFAGQLMIALYRSGRQADALDVYRATAATLADELGLDPGPELQDLHQAVLTADTALLTPQRQVPAQLPADSARFTGRSAELASLLDRVKDPPTVVAISAIDGMAGVGKTALALHAAHRLAPDFPDGQLFIDLHGYTQGVPPVEPADALDRMLRALGVPGAQIPIGLEDRAALYRSTLSGRRMLVVLDNANSDTQVRHLLPGHPGCLVLITSRQRLAGLDSIHQIYLDVLPPAEAVALFTRVIEGDGSTSAEVSEIVELCGRLPLAIRIAAARLRSRPSWSFSHLAERLRSQRLDATGVAAAFELSYEQLPTEHQRAFRLLGLYPGPNIDTYAAAALTDTTVSVATRLLDNLVDAHLLQEPAPGRYQFHDLVRAYAISLETPAPERATALTRLLDHYAHTATSAMDVVYAYETERRPHPPPTAAAVRHSFDERSQAESWLDLELHNLLAVARYGRSHAGHLSATLHRHLIVRGQFIAAEALHEHAVRRARDTGNRAAEVAALNNLADCQWRLGAYQSAIEAHTLALTIARDISDQTGEQAALTGIGYVRMKQTRYPEASDNFGQAVTIARAANDRIGEHNALRGLAYVNAQQDKYEEAVVAYSRALALAREVGYRSGEQAALHGLGYLHYSQAQYEAAAEAYGQALTIARSIGHRSGELQSLAGLADIYYVQGRYQRAIAAYSHALVMVDSIGDRNWQFEILHGLGRTRHATGQLDQAHVLHRRALAIATDIGAPNDQARAHDGLAHTHHALGQLEQARNHWQTALRILEAAGLAHTDDPQVTTTTIHTHLTNLPPDFSA